MRPRRPTRGFGSWLTASLHVLNLLAELLDHGLQFKPDPRQGDIIRLCAQGIRLAPEFLRQEIEAPADRSALVQQFRAPNPHARAAGRAPRGYRRGRRSAPPPDADVPGRARPCRRRARAICASSRARIGSGWRAGDASASSTRREISIELLAEDAGQRLAFLQPCGLQSLDQRADACLQGCCQRLVLCRIGGIVFQLDDAAHGQEAVEGSRLHVVRQLRDRRGRTGAIAAHPG